MSRPTKRTALRDEENRPAPPNQQVNASAVIGPTPYRASASVFAPRTWPAMPSSCRRICSRCRSVASSISMPVAIWIWPAGDT